MSPTQYKLDAVLVLIISGKRNTHVSSKGGRRNTREASKLESRRRKSKLHNVKTRFRISRLVSVVYECGTLSVDYRE